MSPTKKDVTGNRPNRIRFIMLDADISDGNLSELTQAITSALKPTSGQMRQLPPRSSAAPELTDSVPSDSEQIGTDIVDEVAEATTNNGGEPKAARPKPKLPLPAYLHDLKLDGFKEYADTSAPKKHLKRYLLSALWLKEHGNSPTITTDKVYTCYKTASWPIGINDWDAIFRDAVKRNLMRRVSTGEYAITPIGEDALNN
jgi:hypothetical protein